MKTAELDTLTRTLTAFATFQDLLDAQGGYRPSLVKRDAQTFALANAYDAAQSKRGDSRRAFRG